MPDQPERLQPEVGVCVAGGDGGRLGIRRGALYLRRSFDWRGILYRAASSQRYDGLRERSAKLTIPGRKRILFAIDHGVLSLKLLAAVEMGEGQLMRMIPATLGDQAQRLADIDIDLLRKHAYISIVLKD